MLIGYVSDERYLALSDVLFEFTNEHVTVQSSSSASGKVYAELEAGTYTATFQLEGFGPKRVRINAQPGKPYHFRLLSNQLLIVHLIKSIFKAFSLVKYIRLQLACGEKFS